MMVCCKVSIIFQLILLLLLLLFFVVVFLFLSLFPKKSRVFFCITVGLKNINAKLGLDYNRGQNNLGHVCIKTLPSTCNS